MSAPPRFDLCELDDLPTLNEGHTDDLKYDDGSYRVWVFRGCYGDVFPATEDDSPYPLVTVEHLTDGRWVEYDSYEAVWPRAFQRGEP